MTKMKLRRFHCNYPVRANQCDMSGTSAVRGTRGVFHPSSRRPNFFISPYPNMLSLDEDLWHKNGVAFHPFADFVLRLRRHEYITFLKFHKQRFQNLLHFQAFLIRFPNNSHGSRIDDDFPSVFVFVRLKQDFLN